MAFKFIRRNAAKADIPAEETSIGKCFKKAGFPLTDEKFQKMEWFLNFDPSSRDKPIEKDRSWRNNLVEDVLPLLDYERGEEAVKKAEARQGLQIS